MNETALTTTTKQPIAASERGLQLNCLEDYWRFSNYVSKSGLAPKGIDSPESILVALQHGAELGLPPMASLQCIAVINGRPGIYGDAQLAVCRSTGEVEELDEYYEVGGVRIDGNPDKFGDDTRAVIRLKRHGSKVRVESFSVADAKRAGLWGKAGPWSQYPARMLRFRCRSFALRDQFGDALKGMRTVEELQDRNAIEVETVPPAPRISIVATPAPTPQPAHASQPVPPPEPQPTTATEKGAAATPAASVAASTQDGPQSPQDELCGVVTSAGYDLDQFNLWALENGHTLAESGSWDEVGIALCKRLLKARGAFVKGMDAMFKEAK